METPPRSRRWGAHRDMRRARICSPVAKPAAAENSPDPRGRRKLLILSGVLLPRAPWLCSFPVLSGTVRSGWQRRVVSHVHNDACVPSSPSSSSSSGHPTAPVKRAQTLGSGLLPVAVRTEPWEAPTPLPHSHHSVWPQPRYGDLLEHSFRVLSKSPLCTLLAPPLMHVQPPPLALGTCLMPADFLCKGACVWRWGGYLLLAV